MENINQIKSNVAQSLSQFEELTWLRHQQSDSGIGQHALAFRLTGKVVIARLAAALENVYQNLIVLNTHYQFNDEDGLVKTVTSSDQAKITIHYATNEQQALHSILSVQATPFELDSQGAIQFQIYVLPQGEVVVGAIVHSILQNQVSWKQVLSAVSALYNQQSISDYDPMKIFPNLNLTQVESIEIIPCHLAGLQQSSALDQQVLHINVNDTDQPAHPKGTANKFTVYLNLDHLTKFSSSKTDKSAVLVAVAGFFAKQISTLCGQPLVRISVPADLEQRVFELNGTMIESSLVDLVIDCSSSDISCLIAQIEQSLEVSHESEVSETSPHLLVSWLADPSMHLCLDGIKVDRLALPPIHPKFEMALAIGINCKGEGVLELVTSANLSKFAGGLILENLTKVLGGQAQTSIDSVEVALNLPLDECVKLQSNTTLLVQSQTVINERILAEFRSALAVPNMTENDDFFDMGGHSLIATRVIGRLLNQYNIEIHINDLFSYSTVKELAEHAVISREHGNEKEASPIVVTEQSEFPLSLAQNSLWKAKQKYAEFGLHHIFNLPFALRFVNEVNEKALGEAFHDILIRHSGLRTQFGVHNDVPFQRVVSESTLDSYKWFWTSEETEVEPFKIALKRESGYGFDLESELPLRLRFFRDSDSGIQYMSMLFHHIVLDEWSVNIMMEELNHAYRSRVMGKGPIWKFKPLPFHEHALKQSNSGMNQQHQDFWKKHLHDAKWSDPIFDAEHPLSERNSEDQNQGGWVEFKLDKSVSDGLYQLAKNHNASLFNVVYAGIVTSLALLGAPSNMVVGTPAAGRLDAEFFDTVGYFTTMVVHMTRIKENLTVSQLIEQVKNTINGSMPYTDIPIDLIEEALLGEGHEKENHIFEVFIQLHAKNKLNGFLDNGDGSQVEFQQVDPDKSDGGLGLQFEIMEEKIAGEPRIRVLMSYLSKHYSPTQVELLRSTTNEIFNRFSVLTHDDLSLTALKEQLALNNEFIV